MPAGLQAPLAVAQHLLDASAKASEPSDAPEPQERESTPAPCETAEEVAESVSNSSYSSGVRHLSTCRMLTCYVLHALPAPCAPCHPDNDSCFAVGPSVPAADVACGTVRRASWTGGRGEWADAVPERIYAAFQPVSTFKRAAEPDRVRSSGTVSVGTTQGRC